MVLQPPFGLPDLNDIPGTPVYASMAVSYTHLDVYKRQGKEIRTGEVYGSTVSFRLPDKRRGTLSGGTGHGRFWRTAEAVSYTHLDVYKRQVVLCACHRRAGRVVVREDDSRSMGNESRLKDDAYVHDRTVYPAA